MALITFTTCDKIGAAERRFASFRYRNRTELTVFLRVNTSPIQYGLVWAQEVSGIV